MFYDWREPSECHAAAMFIAFDAMNVVSDRTSHWLPDDGGNLFALLACHEALLQHTPSWQQYHVP